MRFLLLTFFITISAQLSSLASEGSPENWCRRIESEGPPFSLAKVIGKKDEKVAFQSDDDNKTENSACPNLDLSRCPLRRYVLPEDMVITARVYRDFACSGYASKKGTLNGWISTKKLQQITIQPPKWEGKWRPGKFGQIIFSKAKDGLIRAEGSTVWIGNIVDEKTGERNVHNGEFNALGKPDENHIRFIQTEDGSYRKESADSRYDCIVDVWQLNNYLMVKDNGMCGGLNVSFDGIYKKE